MNYNNPYNQYGYVNYGNVQQPYNQNQFQQGQQANQYQQPQQMNYLTSIVVNGYQDVEKYIVAPNQTINFYDGKNGYFYLKSADGMGRYTIKAFKLSEMNVDDIINPKPQNTNENNTSNYLTRNDLREYVTVSDLKRLEKEFKDTLDHISQQITNKNNRNNYKKESD